MSELYDSIEELMLELEDEDGDPVGGRTLAIAVSYTHLTLPTISSV